MTVKAIDKGRIVLRQDDGFVHKCMNCKQIILENKYCFKCSNRIDWIATTEDRRGWK